MKKLKDVRIKKGFTQSELSDCTNLNIRTIQHYEQGTKNFDHARLDTLLKICIALDCELSDIIECDEYVALINKYNEKSRS